MRTLLFTMIFVLFPAIITKLFSQGCSDAGMCSIHSIKPSSDLPDTAVATRNTISTGLSFGTGPCHSTRI